MARRRFVKVTEAAEILGIGRTAAYEGAKRYRETNGADGIKVVAVGGSLRVPVAWLEQMAGGPIDLDIDVAPPPATTLEVHSNPNPEPDTRRTSTRARATRPSPQLDLFNPPAAS